MQVTAKFQSLISVLLPKAEYDMRFTSSLERLITIEAESGRVDIYSKNSGDTHDPSWSKPLAKFTLRQSLHGLDTEQVKRLSDFIFAAEKVLVYWSSLNEAELIR